MALADPTVVRDYYEYVDAEEYDAMLSLFAADVTYDRPGRPTLDDAEDLREFYLHERSLTDGTHEIEQLLVDGDTVVVRGRFAGEQDGEAVAFGFADFHRFDEDGDIAERWTYTDRDEV